MTNLKIKHTTIVEQVMSKIKTLIASGAYKPDDKMPTELELAESFGVGRSTIREAIKIFNYLGVLESRTAKGTYVQERSHISTEALTWSLLLGNDDLNEMIDLRGAIELWAMFKLCSSAARKDNTALEVIDKLETIVSDMENAASEGDRKRLIDDDFQFHFTILSGSGNSLFLSLFETLKSFLYDEIGKSQVKYKNLYKIPKEHEILLNTLKAGTSLQVFTAYTEHISNIKEKLKPEKI